ncbi:MAG: histidine kinase, partial [Bacteroidetes bacterium]
NGDGFGSESENGIGLRNTKTRVEYLGGKFMMDTEGSETVFMIEIPI